MGTHNAGAWRFNRERWKPPYRSCARRLGSRRYLSQCGNGNRGGSSICLSHRSCCWNCARARRDRLAVRNIWYSFTINYFVGSRLYGGSTSQLQLIPAEEPSMLSKPKIEAFIPRLQIDTTYFDKPIAWRARQNGYGRWREVQSKKPASSSLRYFLAPSASISSPSPGASSKSTMLSFTILAGKPMTRSSHQGSEALGYSNAT